jgi:hypothetical protein
LLLDPLILSLSVQSSKSHHQDGMHITMKDPDNVLLSLINPGDWVVCWMFNSSEDATLLRYKLRKGEYDSLNDFNSGLKFVGKALAPRIQHVANGESGTFTKMCTLQATAFSELDSNIYYDPQMNTNLGRGFEFMSDIAAALNDKFNGIPRQVNEILGILLPVLLGKPPLSGGQKTPNSPMRVPSIIGRILGRPNAGTFMDILIAILGIQKYGDDYLPPLGTFMIGPQLSPPSLDNIGASRFRLATTKGSAKLSLGLPSLSTGDAGGSIITPHTNIFATGKGLTGAVYAQIAPFSNVPLWSILEQHLIPVANEMYSALRLGPDGGIMPHLIMRQIPFNTDSFVSRSASDFTAFRELPRWKVTPEVVASYDTGKSNSMRVNYVQIQVTGGLGPNSKLQDAFRAMTSPRWDSVDIGRNGLKPFIAQVNGTYEVDATLEGQKWTDMVTDRLIGSHLKLSGSIATAGFQEPIAVGDNLEYDGFVYHIEGVEHKLQVNPQSGQKSFLTNLAISNGVPATGNALPEIAIRQFNSSTSTSPGAKLLSDGSLSAVPHLQISSTSTQTGSSKAVRHAVVPLANFEGD